MAKSVAIKGLYYITHVSNLPSILEYGILSHEEVSRRQLPYQPIYDDQIIARRHERFVGGEASLWSYANLYFNPRNAMLYRVMHERARSEVAIIQVDRAILDLPGVHVAVGNAASAPSQILPMPSGLDQIREAWPIINREYWKEEDGSKRITMAEALVPHRVEPEFIRSVYVASIANAASVSESLGKNSRIHVVAEPALFFLPTESAKIAPNISIIDGDMFFSQMQTLTISVNTVGVMGKGLASRTRYQFPDVYVEYEERCKSKDIAPGKPWLYKRERSLDDELAYSPSTLRDANSSKWFLLFPTKRHWKEPSRVDDIENGLIWLADNYERLQIRSLALPALGCGLGGLTWAEVGPLMSRYLRPLKMISSIYLPRELITPEEQVTSRFLLE